MNDDKHYYDTQIEWVKNRRGTLYADGLPEMAVSSPPEFRGEPGFWTPEHLFVAAAESCLMATFVAIAEFSKLPIAAYRSSAKGKLGRIQGAGWRFTELTISPVVELESAEDRPLAERVMAKAAKGCLISNSMLVSMRVEPRFAVREAVAA